MSPQTTRREGRPSRLSPAAPVPATPALVRVASVPSNHVYVRHLSSPSGSDRVVRLPDPPPLREDAAPGQWWPPAVLDPTWVRDHAGEFDLAHVHFGFDAFDPERLIAFADALEAAGKPLVVTAHDLRNPHHPTPELHHAQLGALLSRAAQVITLTPSAARGLRRGWGVEALVLPHPHVVDVPWLDRPRPATEGFVVGVHCKSLRANLRPLPVIETLVGMRPEMPDLRVRVDVHEDVLQPGSVNHDPETVGALRAWEAAGAIELHVHGYFDDAELYEYLIGLDVSVLPYRFGTHSGWLEACYDLGTSVVAPSCGCYADQRPVHGFVMEEDCFDPPSLVAAVRSARAAGPATRPGATVRLRERRLLSVVHEDVYRRALESTHRGAVRIPTSA